MASGMGSAGGDTRQQCITLTATDGTATWSVTGITLSYIYGVSFAKAQDAAPTADDEGNYYIDQDKETWGGWTVTSNTIAVARVIQATGGTLAADNVSMVLTGI